MPNYNNINKNKNYKYNNKKVLKIYKTPTSHALLLEN